MTPASDERQTPNVRHHQFFKIARVLVWFDHVASRIVNANRSIK
jgi:hypothetical protein